MLVIGGKAKDATKVVVFSPADAAWTDLPPPATGRNAHTATLLKDGSVLTVYYITCEDRITHIASTRWKP